MNGLLDFFKNQDWSSNRVDPGANARALMGGQSMQYNQQPQSLLSNVYGEGTDTFKNETGIIDPQNITPQQSQQMTYQGTPQAGVQYPNFDPSAINPYLDGDQTDGNGGYVDTSYNNRLNSAPVNSMLMGNAQTPQGVVGVDPNAEQVVIEDPTDYSKEAQVDVGQPVVTSTPFQWPWEAFGNQQTIEEKIRAQAIAKQKLIERGLISPK